MKKTIIGGLLPDRERKKVAKTALMTLGVTAAGFIMQMIGTPQAHADVGGGPTGSQMYLYCLRAEGVNSSGRLPTSDDWWLRLGRAINTDLENGYSRKAVMDKLMNEVGLSLGDTLNVTTCAVTWRAAYPTYPN